MRTWAPAISLFIAALNDIALYPFATIAHPFGVRGAHPTPYTV